MKIVLPIVAALNLGACAQNQSVQHSYGNDALPSAEVTAFQKVDARLKYRDARIERDASGCAVYEGTAPDGTRKREALIDGAGRPICSK